MRNIFRKEVVDYRKSQLNSGEMILPNTFSIKIFIMLIFIIILMIVMITIFGNYTERKTVFGYLSPDKGVVNISSPYAGVIKYISIEEGARVTTKQEVVSIENEVFSHREGYNAYFEESLNQRLNALEERKLLEIKSQAQSEELLRVKRNSIEKNIEINLEDIRRQEISIEIAESKKKTYEDLYNLSAVSKQELDSTIEAVLADKFNLSSLKRNEIVLGDELEANNNATKKVIIDIQRVLNEINIDKINIKNELIEFKENKYTVLDSPINGTVTNIYIHKEQLIKPLETLFTIVPDNSILEGNLIVPSSNLSHISVGDTVSIKYNDFSFYKHGQKKGTIKSISKYPVNISKINESIGLNLNNLTPESYYLVKLKIDNQEFIIEGNKKKLEYGMTFTADIISSRRRLYEWILEPFKESRNLLR